MDTEAKNALGDKDSIMNQSVTAVYPPPPNPSYLPEKYLLFFKPCSEKPQGLEGEVFDESLSWPPLGPQQLVMQNKSFFVSVLYNTILSQICFKIVIH